MRYLVFALMALALVLPAAPAHAQAAPSARVTQVDTARYPDVTLYVSVTDAAGNPVPNLRPGDFTITEDGRPVEIRDFAGGGAGSVTTVLVIDRSNSMREVRKLDGARDAAHAYVALMRPGDRTALIAFDGNGAQVLRRFTDDRRFLDEAIDGIRFGGGTAIYDALIEAVDLLKNEPGRRALVLLTDGQDCRDLDSYNCPAEAGSRSTMSEAIAYAGRANQPVYTIGLGTPGGSEREGIDADVLRAIAEATGGEYFYAPRPGHLAELYQRLAGGIHAEYRITYRSPRPFYDGTRRDIQVSVGGMPVVTDGYVERHMVNIHSNPVVAVFLLIPILAAFLAPLLLRHNRAYRAPAAAPPATAESTSPAAPTSAAASPVDTGPADGPTIGQMGETALEARSCWSCGTPVILPARFCDQCGAPQDRGPASCADCGRALRPGAKFCPGCGTPVGRGVVTSDE